MMRIIIIILILLLTSCFNDNRVPTSDGPAKPQTAQKTPGTTTSNSGSLRFIISNVSVATAQTGSSEQSQVATLFFSSNNAVTLNDFCQVNLSDNQSNNTRSCKCLYQWSEVIQSDATTIARAVETKPTQITSFQVQCPVPDVYANEITDGTVIKVSFVPDVAAGNTSGFTTNTFSHTKQTTAVNGDFRDAEGHSYKDVYHYVCYDQAKQNLMVRHAPNTNFTDGDSKVIPALLANVFDYGQTGEPSSFSAQSYYYDFYVRSHEIGSINATAGGYTCPQVNINGASGTTTGVPTFFPLDSTFALSLNSSDKFNIPVQNQVILPTNADPAGNPSGTTLGFAAPANSDGTCPVFKDDANKLRQTFRLRRYIAVYPLRYNADGNVLGDAQSFNSVYVLDRLVKKSTNSTTTKPLTRLGPKPCPFSFKTAQFGYKCSNDASLAGWNINGIQIDGDPSCPIYPPIKPKHLKPDGTLVIRPYKPFTPHYLEDTSFKACTFVSSKPVDPEIVVAHDATVFSATTGPHDFYCSKNYPPAGAVIPPSSGDPFNKLPGDCDLLSITNAMKDDKTYSCEKTYDPTSNGRITPAAGCCQICSGNDCSAQGGGTTPSGRNAAFSPPQDSGNPNQASKVLPRSIPGSSSNGCFDPSED